MKNRILTLLVSGCMLASMCILPAGAVDAPAEDESSSAIIEPTDPVPGNAEVVSSAWGSDYDTATEFEISSVDDLLAFAKMVNDGKNFEGKTVTLSTSLDLTDIEWKPIGIDDAVDVSGVGVAFAGTFDGTNFTISNLNLKYGETDDDPYYACGGFFGKVTGEIKNVNLENLVIVAAGDHVGGIAGLLAEGGRIDHCTVDGSISGATYDGESYGSYVGGIAGQSFGEIVSCANNCNLTNTIHYVGGIAGEVEDGTISDCVNTGSLGGYAYTGGIVGASKDSTISNCSNSGAITGNKWEEYPNENRRIGGIVGEAQTVDIKNCKNNGSITAEDVHEVGGIAGQLYFGSSIEECSNSGNIVGGDETGGIAGYALAYYTGGYNVSNCTNSGSVYGASGVGGIVGLGTANNNDESEQVISGCSNSGSISGSGNIGGIVGEHNSNTGFTGSGTNAAEVSGCINTGSVPEDGGAIVGKNNNASTSDESSLHGIVQNNFWPVELNLPAVGDSDESEESQDAVKNNSSYREDGSLITPVEDDTGNEISDLGTALENALGAGNVPESMKVTASFDTNGHGTVEAISVTLGDSVTLPDPGNYGYYHFVGWTDGTTQYAAGENVKMMKDTTFTAVWNYIPPANPNYKITIGDMENGSVTANPTAAKAGATVTLTATPDEGYAVGTLTVTDRFGDAVKVTEQADGTYTFVMPNGQVTVDATFVASEEPAPAEPFTDVDENDWFYDEVVYVYANGLMDGVGDNRFAPNTTTNRAMLATILYRLAGEPDVSGDLPFTDVAAGQWYTDAVLWAAQNDIVNGVGENTFAPSNDLTREQLVTMLYRYAEAEGYDVSAAADLSGYPDAGQVQTYAQEAMSWAVAEGIVEGMDGILNPAGNATRAQIATILMRFCENVVQ